jgi:hypothetical protein
VGAVATALHGLADVLLSQRDLDAAERRYAEALQICHELKTPRRCNYCLRGLAATAAQKGEMHRAGRLWGAANAVEHESGFGIVGRTYSHYTTAMTNVAGAEFDAAVAEGLQLSLDEAVRYALTMRRG